MEQGYPWPTLRAIRFSLLFWKHLPPSTLLSQWVPYLVSRLLFWKHFHRLGLPSGWQGIPSSLCFLCVFHRHHGPKNDSESREKVPRCSLSKGGSFLLVFDFSACISVSVFVCACICRQECICAHAHMYEGLRLKLGNLLPTNVALKRYIFLNCMFTCVSERNFRCLQRPEGGTQVPRSWSYRRLWADWYGC